MHVAAAIEKNPVDALVGEIKTFGPAGPRYEVLKPLKQLAGGEWLVSICLIESGEVTEYHLSDILADPEAV
jgi:hypothetical protein